MDNHLERLRKRREEFLGLIKDAEERQVPPLAEWKRDLHAIELQISALERGIERPG
jgi:hypothetical protein